MKSFACVSWMCLLAVTACDRDDEGSGGTSATRTADGEHPDDVDAAPRDADVPPDSGGGDDPDCAPVERGEYLVKVVALCGDCHTPRNPDGSFDMTRFLGGNPSFVDTDPSDDAVGNLPAPNLTPHATGLAGWTADEVKAAFLDGIEPDGEALFPVMPYYVYHNITDKDADAIAAYLATVEPVDHEVPERQPPFSLIEAPASPFPVEDIPDSKLDCDDPHFEEAQRGRYLAGFVGICMECHTKRTDEMDPSSLDRTKLFAGDEPFEVGKPLGTVYSSNITPDRETGIGKWSAEDLRVALKEGVEPDGEALCPPMPSGPAGPFAGFTDRDAEAIGHYLLSIEPIENEPTAECQLPVMGQ